MERNVMEELMEYSLKRIKSYKDEKHGESFFGQYSPRLNDSEEGTLEIKAPRKYRRKKRLERRLETAVKEFYLKQGFHLKKIIENGKEGSLYFEREINYLERYRVLIERQGIFFYIHVLKERK